MAADVGQRFSGWSYSDPPYNDHNAQDNSVQRMVIDHGSVSFGRFAAESLSWEKRSVFAHNRRQEELSKLTAPGLVAQKKAFFEEYYKRARHLKAQGTVNVATIEQRNHENDLAHSSQADQLPAAFPGHPMATDPNSSVEHSTEVSSSDEGKGQDAHELGYLTFNPLFSQTAGLQSIQEEERSSSGEKQYLHQEFPSADHTNSSHGLSCEALERKVLAPRRVVPNDNGEDNVAGSRIVLPIASLQVRSEGLTVDLEKRGARENVAIINRPTRRLKDLSTSAMHIPRVDSRRNSENRPSQDLKDPFHKRVEMKLRALSDRMDADSSRTSASSRSASYQPPSKAMTSCAYSRSASYQPPSKAMTSCRSSHQNADRLATSSRSSLCQNSNRVLAPSKSSAQPSKAMQRPDTLPRGILFNKGSHASYAASSNSTATAKILVMPNSSQVNGTRTSQVSLKRAAGLTNTNNGSQNKRKQLSTPSTLDGNNQKRGYVRTSAPPSARSSSENLPPAAKAPKISNRMNVTKTELVQKSRSASHPVGARYMLAKHSMNCNEQNRKAIPLHAGNLAESRMKSIVKGGPPLNKNKPRQERPRWR